ncbi:MAG: hypothetical protein V8S08_09930 [Lachnoclostridium sp.]
MTQKKQVLCDLRTLFLIFNCQTPEQQYLPEEIKKARFYEPSDNGKEKEIKEWMEFIRKQH